MQTAIDPRKLDALQKIRERALQQLAQRPPEEVAAAAEKHRLRNRILFDFPDSGPLRRELYPRQMDFFASSAEHTELCFVASNRCGRSRAAADGVAYHMTGMYPHWWVGRRFNKPSVWWTANESWKRVRDVNQLELLGAPDREDLQGTGAIPFHLLHRPVPNPHIKFGIESFQVRHVSGGLSSCQFKTYEQGWKEFEGSKIDGIWLDEQCPEEIYTACKMRIAATDGSKNSRNGIIFLTFTPLEGLTPLLMRLKERAVNADTLGW